MVIKIKHIINLLNHNIKSNLLGNNFYAGRKIYKKLGNLYTCIFLLFYSFCKI